MFKKHQKWLYVLMALFLMVSIQVFAEDGDEPTDPTANTNVRVQMMNGITNETTENIITKFMLYNDGDTVVNVSDIKVRYYYTVDGDRTQNFWCDYASVGGANVTGKFVKLATPVAGADYYLEVGFVEGTGSLEPGASIEVQTRFAKADWSSFNQTNDYSFNLSALSYGDWTSTPGYVAGILTWGSEPPYIPVPVVTDQIRLQMYNGNITAINNTIFPRFQVYNDGDTIVNLTEVKLRYYYTSDGEQAQNFWCDWSSIGAANVTGKFVKLATPIAGADSYLEIGFTAGTILPKASIELHTRIAKADWAIYNQADDYSFDAVNGSYADWGKALGYVGGVVKWGNVVTNYQELKDVLCLLEQDNGGAILIKTSKMSCDSQLRLQKENSNIRLEAYPGYTPILDFSPIRQLNGDDYTGIKIIGSYYYIKGLIIQKAGDNGLQIKPDITTKTGTSCYNTIENCIFRYNGDAGIQISGSTSMPEAAPGYNTFINVYCYRNFDIDTNGGNADGFSCKLNPGPGNKFINCYAWENSDDGWDLYADYYDVTLVNCVTWHNSDPKVFSGEYDFNNGRPLDDNMIMVAMFLQDPTFNANLAAGSFVLPGEMIIPTSGQTVAETLTNWKGNSNGFKLGSASSKYGPQTNGTRTLTNCVTFNNLKKGFDQNNGGDTSYITNGISFNNNQNYQLNLQKLPVFINNKSFNGVSSDKLAAGASVIKVTDPLAKQAIIDEVNSKCNLIMSTVKNDQIPLNVTFNLWNN